MIKKIFVIILGLSVFNIANAVSNESNRAQQNYITQNKAITLIKSSIKRNRLSELSTACMDFYILRKDNRYIEFSIHEKHNRKCGGDPQTSPRLFNYIVDRSNGKLYTDAMRDGYEWDGEYHSIR